MWQEEDLKFDKQPQWPNSFEPIAYSPDRGTLRVCPNCKDIKPDGQNFPLVLKKKQKRKAKSSITKKQKQAKPSTAKQQQQRAKPSTAKTQQPQQEEEPEASTSKQAEQASTSEQAVADDDPRLQCGLKERLTTAHATLNAPRSTRYLVVVPYVKIEDPSKPNGHKVNRVKLDQLRVTPHERQRFHGFWELDHTTNKYTFNTTQQKEYRLVGYSLYSRKDYGTH